jgi:protein-disulfide isomerase
MDRKFIVILVVLVLGLGGIFWFGQKDSGTTNTNNSNASVSNHSKGENTKNVELLVYADFQCPVCGQFFPVEKAVVDKYQKEIKFTFRHFPLDSIHQNARAASRAAEAAGKQGKFFEMHDLLFENQQSWSEVGNPKSVFDAYAKQLSLNQSQFDADFAAEVTNDTINADRNAGSKVGVSGTPTYFLNGKKLENGDISTVESFSAKIDEAIKASSGN